MIGSISTITREMLVVLLLQDSKEKVEAMETPKTDQPVPASLEPLSLPSTTSIARKMHVVLLEQVKA